MTSLQGAAEQDIIRDRDLADHQHSLRTSYRDWVVLDLRPRALTRGRWALGAGHRTNPQLVGTEQNSLYLGDIVSGETEFILPIEQLAGKPFGSAYRGATGGVSVLSSKFLGGFLHYHSVEGGAAPALRTLESERMAKAVVGGDGGVVLLGSFWKHENGRSPEEQPDYIGRSVTAVGVLHREPPNEAGAQNLVAPTLSPVRRLELQVRAVPN